MRRRQNSDSLCMDFFAVLTELETMHFVYMLCNLTKRLWKLFATLSILNSSETPRTVYYAEFLQLWLTTLHAIFVRIVVKKDENYHFSRQDLIYFTFDKLPHCRVPLKSKFY
jgi:hypothetical protein